MKMHPCKPKAYNSSNMKNLIIKKSLYSLIKTMSEPGGGYSGVDPVVLENDGVHFANQAVEHDKTGRYQMAVFYYNTLPTHQKPQEKQDLEKATFLLNQAFDEDENENYREAKELEMKQKIKFSSRKAPVSPKPAPKQTNEVRRPLGYGAFLDDDDNVKKNSQPVNSGAPPKTTAVPRNVANASEYVPFMSVDTKERFAFPIQFSDKDGKLVLSPKQKQKISKWVRPEDFCDSPQIIYAVSCFSIKQTIVSDCSFVASLAISAQYERRFKKKLITSIIYPQNRQGEPVYNPCGKYMIKLNINGVNRKVIVDDFLPMGQDGQLLCSFSNNKNELWVSLLEKSYMKVMGGYDFPGSNSNIDLHALTGWIPERVAIRPGSQEFDPDKEFRRIVDRFHKGHCLITIATGELSEAEG
ncbi:hypothetical protein KUTeg_008826 [Tegillarca granosa]|uniref:Calpain catalytic domain-containing protein n=1 Tax=Tegillarca granosa TaxID=220873 RepID=A0ABQ9FF21_TEGGR|nr:hypothetical protein KUTeg_008826 [Tegillarca granosa]